ncbi:hypothetical protein GGTG_05194 [Gaeumannomyces tritici R3-111a-1]|uniref:Uncharacterized protein n=1 Tax=Gaeumannomyces tritici (strain R3-111a-1) TaxID=644352 RepID=J3NV81_GAET3|nr:hypothetical protein GGTG_05194 [Gaeumannomyces tritici R3-111a-1]EJT75257.1 hypothetical protein GGTG_05194 [Gaeumannomyces tritici R3-111a-1]
MSGPAKALPQRGPTSQGGVSGMGPVHWLTIQIPARRGRVSVQLCAIRAPMGAPPHVQKLVVAQAAALLLLPTWTPLAGQLENNTGDWRTLEESRNGDTTSWRIDVDTLPVAQKAQEPVSDGHWVPGVLAKRGGIGECFRQQPLELDAGPTTPLVFAPTRKKPSRASTRATPHHYAIKPGEPAKKGGGKELCRAKSVATS